MDTEKLPSCLCGSRDFEGGGGSFGGQGSQQWYSCTRCKRSFNLIQHACNLIITTVAVPVEPDCGHKETCGGRYSSGPGDSDWVDCKFHAADLPRFNEIYVEQVASSAKGERWYGHSDVPEYRAYTTEEVHWIQTDLEIHIRSKREQSRTARERIERTFWEIACDELGVPHDIKFKEYREDPTDTSKDYKRSLRIWQKPDGTEITDQAFDKMFLARQDQLRKLLGRDGNLSTVSIPPRIPVTLKVAIPVPDSHLEDPDKNWHWVGTEESKNIPLPSDPLRLKHNKLFNEVFARVEIATGVRIERSEIPNRYYKDTLNSEPWFTFKIGDRVFVVGPRKRVVNMEVLSDRPMLTVNIKTLADRDNVTYEADGGWKSLLPEAKSIRIHAYGMDKTVEYLTTMIKSDNPTGSSVAATG